VPSGWLTSVRILALEEPLTASEDADLSDLLLVEGVVLRRETALAEIFRRHARSVAATAGMVLGNSSACDDVVAEVFLALWLRPEGFDSQRGSLRGFLRLKARGRSIDIVRSDVARRRREMSEERAHGRYTKEIEEEFLTSVAAEQMQKAVAGLDEREREPIELAFFTGLSYKDVAEHLKLPEGTVKARIRSGLHHVRVAFESQRLIEAEAEGSIRPSDRGGK
jgi:RNA polymerase sigma-70 factor (ECF subfamily)